MTTTTIDGTTVQAWPVVTLPLAAFRDLVTAAAVAAGKDNTLPTLTGIRVEWEQRTLRMVSTDRYRLVRAEYALDPSAPAFTDSNEVISTLVPAADLVAFVKALPKPGKYAKSPFYVVISLHEGEVRLSCSTWDGDISRTVRTLEGDFPKYQSLIPTEFAGLDGDGIGVNPKYLADVAKMPMDRASSAVRVRFTASGRPMVWEPTSPLDSGVTWLYLLMPVRIGQ